MVNTWLILPPFVAKVASCTRTLYEAAIVPQGYLLYSIHFALLELLQSSTVAEVDSFY